MALLGSEGLEVYSAVISVNFQTAYFYSILVTHFIP